MMSFAVLQDMQKICHAIEIRIYTSTEDAMALPLSSLLLSPWPTRDNYPSTMCIQQPRQLPPPVFIFHPRFSTRPRSDGRVYVRSVALHVKVPEAVDFSVP